MTASLIDRLAARAQGVYVEPPQTSALLNALALVPDPRDPRGVIHPLPSLLAVAVAAVLASARSIAATSRPRGGSRCCATSRTR